jgi:hypothetical protein
MAVAQPFIRSRAIISAFILILTMHAGCRAHAEDAHAADNAYLDALQGDWDMTGTLLGKPVTYHARGERIRARRISASAHDRCRRRPNLRGGFVLRL